MHTYIFIIAQSLGSLVFLILISLHLPKNICVTIASLSWERRVVVERKVWVKRTSTTGFPQISRNGRETRMPLYSSSYIYISEKVYEYEVPQWRYSRTLLCTGKSQSGVDWPNGKLASNERPGKRKECYDVCFTTAKGKHYRIKLAQNVWEKLDVNAHYLIRRNIFGKITKVARTNKI